MIRLIVSAALLVLLAVFLSFNLQSTTSVSVFGIRVDQVPTAALSLLCFAAGVVYSLFLYIGHLLHQRRRRRLDERHAQLTEREQALDARMADEARKPQPPSEQIAPPPVQNPSSDASATPPSPRGGKVRALWKRLF